MGTACLYVIFPTFFSVRVEVSTEENDYKDFGCFAGEAIDIITASYGFDSDCLAKIDEANQDITTTRIKNIVAGK